MEKLKKMICKSDILKTIILLTLSILMNNCSGQNDKRAFQEIEYHQESYILLDFLKYYKEDFGEYPNDLEEITKLFYNDSIDYSGVNKSNIKANIRDHFSGKNYKYRLIDENSLILYSVGPDRVDDNSNISDELRRSKGFHFKHFNKDSLTGDILIYHLKDNQIIDDFTDVTKLY